MTHEEFMAEMDKAKSKVAAGVDPEVLIQVGKERWYIRSLWAEEGKIVIKNEMRES
jgi:hypothetical protein